jgi:multiple sugar transport system substrate-binding protein
VAIAGCTGGDGGDGGNANTTTQDPSELPAVHWLTDYSNEAWQTKWDELSSSFDEETGIGADIEFVGGQGSGEQRLANLIQAGNTPDLFTSNPVAVADLFSSGQMVEVSDLLDEVTSVNGDITAQPVLRDAEGTPYEIPHGYYVATLLYREDVYDALGLSEPSNFQELLENSRAIDESDEFDTRGFAVPAVQNGPLAAALFRTFYNNMGYGRFRWKSDAREEPEVWFPKEPAVELLEYLKELAQYSPPPSQISFVSGLQDWGAGAYGHLNHLNMWPGGVAAAIDAEVAQNTGVTNMPLDDGVSKEEVPITLTSSVDGHYVLGGGDNTPGAKELLGWLYGRDVETTAQLYAQEPMRFLPGYGDVLGTDTFSGLDYFSNFPSHIEKLRKIERIGEEYFNNVEANNEVMSSGPVMYAGQGLLLATLMNDVIVVGDDPGAAVDKYKSDLQERLEEGKRRFS